MKRLVSTGLAGVAAVLILNRPAAAQEASVTEGPGYQVGEGTVVHPSVNLETGWISNVFYEETDPVSSPIVRLIGGIWIANQGNKSQSDFQPGVLTENDEPEDGDADVTPVPSKLDFRLGAQLILMGYATTNDRARDQSDIAGALDGHLVAFPDGDVAFWLDDQFIRDARPKNFETFGGLNRDFNHLGLGIKYQPGGHALAIGARYENTIDRFESSGAAFANRLQHLIGLRGEYQWLPITKFYVDASYGFFGGLGGSATGFKSGSNPLRIQAGIGTALTVLTSLRAHVGYANGFYSTGENFGLPIGGVEFGYQYSPYGRFALVADFDFHDSLQANFYQDLLLGAKVDHQFGLFLAGADAGVRLRGYRGIPAAIGPASRDDVVFNAAAKGQYLFREGMAITARLEGLIDQTDYMYSAGGVSKTPKFTRFEAFLGAAAAF